jgi:hypothetical protein
LLQTYEFRFDAVNGRTFFTGFSTELWKTTIRAGRRNAQIRTAPRFEVAVFLNIWEQSGCHALCMSDGAKCCQPFPQGEELTSLQVNTLLCYPGLSNRKVAQGIEALVRVVFVRVFRYRVFAGLQTLEFGRELLLLSVLVGRSFANERPDDA